MTRNSKSNTTACILGVFIWVSILIWTNLGYNQVNIDEEFEAQLPFNKCYVITLSGSAEGRRRWKVIQKHKQLSYFTHKWEGIYGKTFDYHPQVKQGIITEIWNRGKWHGTSDDYVRLDPGEIGCSLSHYFLWKHIAEEGTPITLILEDDAINVAPSFISNVNILMNEIPKNWDILLLGFWLHRGERGYPIKYQNGSDSIFYRVFDFATTHSYCLSLNGAKKLLSMLPINKPLDTWISSVSKNLNIYRHNLVLNKASKYPASSLIRQERLEKQIKNTNNW